MHFFNDSVNLGNLTLEGRVLLAPLAGVSEVPFRLICQELGASLTYVEMLSAAAICYQNKRTLQMRARHKNEKILGVQLTGNNPEEIARAISILDTEGFETIDINMGCPVRKVVTGGAGSAILKEPERISKTVQMARAATQKPLSAKVRLGYTRETVNIEDTIKRICTNHVEMFTIHGRTRSEQYNTPCDLAGIAKGVAVSQTNEVFQKKILTVGNGDIFCPESAEKMRLETNCDAVMVSRGALGNPWVFSQIRGLQKEHPTFEEWLDVVLKHIGYQEEHFGNTNLAAVLMRKHLLWYAKGFPNSKGLREALNNVESLSEARERLQNFAKNVPKSFVRYAESKCDSLQEYQELAE